MGTTVSCGVSINNYLIYKLKSVTLRIKSSSVSLKKQNRKSDFFSNNEMTFKLPFLQIYIHMYVYYY